MKSYEMTISKKGIPCLWERGGGFSNSGQALIIADKNFQPKMAVYVRSGGHLANGNHALIPVTNNDHIVEIYRQREDFRVWIYQIRSLDTKNANTELVYEFSNGEWNQTPPETSTAAIDAAKAKASDYHCRKPYFIKLPEKVS